MFRYLTPEEYQRIPILRAEGFTPIQIAHQLNVSDATVYNILNGKSQPRQWSDKPKSKKGATPRLPVVEVKREDVNFKKLPDTVLFEHVKECNFIG